MATAGAGKTSVLLARYRRLREKIPVEDILSLTFTAAAAKSMREKAGEAASSSVRPCGFSTFHSFCLSVATQSGIHYAHPLQPFPLATPGQTVKIVGEVCRRYGLDFRPLQNYISKQKRQYIDANTAVSKSEESGEDLKEALAYREYETRLRDMGLLDFDSLLTETVVMFASKPKVRENYQYQYIQVDEAQDTDFVQLRLVQQLAEKHGNVYFVGDSNQNIYSWRGSSSDLLTNFEQYFPGGQTLYLNTNYRSTKKLTSFNYDIAPFQPPEKYVSPHEEGEPPLVLVYPDEFSEAEKVAKGIHYGRTIVYYKDISQPRLNLFPGAIVEGDSSGDIKLLAQPTGSTAILARTNSALRLFEEELSQSDVRYYLLGKSGYWQQPEVKNVLAYLQCAVMPTDAAIQGAIGAPFHPAKFIKKKDLVDNLKRTCDRTSESMWTELQRYRAETDQQQNCISSLRSFISGLSRYRESRASDAVKGVLTDLRALEYYKEEEESLDNDPVSNLQELARICWRFRTLREFLEHVRKIKAASRVKKGVAVGTIHSAKGLEWDTVFLVNAQEGVLPHKRSTDIEEEKRVFFVGCSRAAKRLIITYSGPPSQFIRQLLPERPEELCSRAF